MRFGNDLERVGVPLGYIDGLVPEGGEMLRMQAREKRRLLVRPQPVDRLDWAESGIIQLPQGTGYSAGPFRALPFQREIIRAPQEPGAKKIWFLKVPRLGWSFMMSIMMIYLIAHEDRNVIFYERSLRDAQTFHVQYFWPILQASPVPAVNLVLESPTPEALGDYLAGVRKSVFDYDGEDRSLQSRLLRDEMRLVGKTSEQIMKERRPLAKPKPAPKPEGVPAHAAGQPMQRDPQSAAASLSKPWLSASTPQPSPAQQQAPGQARYGRIGKAPRMDW